MPGVLQGAASMDTVKRRNDSRAIPFELAPMGPANRTYIMGFVVGIASFFLFLCRITLPGDEQVEPKSGPSFPDEFPWGKNKGQLGAVETIAIPVERPDEEYAQIWEKLNGKDPLIAHHARWDFVASGEQGAAYLRQIKNTGKGDCPPRAGFLNKRMVTSGSP